MLKKQGLADFATIIRGRDLSPRIAVKRIPDADLHGHSSPCLDPRNTSDPAKEVTIRREYRWLPQRDKHGRVGDCSRCPPKISSEVWTEQFRDAIPVVHRRINTTPAIGKSSTPCPCITAAERGREKASASKILRVGFTGFLSPKPSRLSLAAALWNINAQGVAIRARKSPDRKTNKNCCRLSTYPLVRPSANRQWNVLSQ